MSTRSQPRCSQCGQTGHNRRTCDRMRQLKDYVKLELTKKEIVVSKMVPKKPEPEKHNCPICCCDIKEEKDSMCLPCGHHFHVTCGLKWLQHNNTCPCCRAECGEKPKKLPVITDNVAAALAGELFNSSNILINISQQNQSICEHPWNYPGYREYLNTGASQTVIDYTEQELKDKWDDETSTTQIRLKCRFLYQHNAMSLGSMMMQGFASARLYQEGDFDLSEVLINQAESGTISVQIPIAPTSDEQEDSDIDDIPELEEEDTESLLSEASTLEVGDGFPFTEFPEITSQELDDEAEEIANDFTLDAPMTMEELEVLPTSLTAQVILDYHSDITGEEALDIINSLSSPPTTPEPAPIQVPNAPRRRRRGRSELQSPPSSPRAVSDQHVTRRSSERIRQRYRRRRLQEEQDYSLTM